MDHLVLVGALLVPPTDACFDLLDCDTCPDFFTTLLLGHGHGIVPHGELVFVVSLLPVMPLFVCI